MQHGAAQCKARAARGARHKWGREARGADSARHEEGAWHEREVHVARGVGAHTQDGDRKRRGARRETRDTRDARRVRSDRVRREFF
jgi:hypothetical protein